MRRLSLYCQIAMSPTVTNRALKASIIVGSTLNLINQYEAITSLDSANIDILKLLLTYLVPYGVTTYTATVLQLDFKIGTHSSVDADLICKGCQAEVHVNKDELIPECPSCGIHTKWTLKKGLK